MMLGEWQAKIAERYDRMDIGLFLYRDVPGAREFLKSDGTVQPVKEGLAKDDLAFATFKDSEQLQSVAAALSNFGIKTEAEHKLAGVLDAQTKHLEDMRALVFKRKPS